MSGTHLRPRRNESVASLPVEPEHGVAVAGSERLQSVVVNDDIPIVAIRAIEIAQTADESSLNSVPFPIPHCLDLSIQKRAELAVKSSCLAGSCCRQQDARLGVQFAKQRDRPQDVLAGRQRDDTSWFPDYRFKQFTLRYL